MTTYTNAAGEEVHGPRRKAPPYYIGETYRGRATTKDADRWPNGALVGKRNKAARRLIRKAFGKALSRIEQHVMKARDARNEVQRLATNSHEAKRYWEQTLALHQPAPRFKTRSEMRAKTRGIRTANRAKEQERRVEQMEHQREAQEKRDREHALLTKSDRNRPIAVVRINGKTLITIDPGFIE